MKKLFAAILVFSMLFSCGKGDAEYVSYIQFQGDMSTKAIHNVSDGVPEITWEEGDQVVFRVNLMVPEDERSKNVLQESDFLFRTKGLLILENGVWETYLPTPDGNYRKDSKVAIVSSRKEGEIKLNFDYDYTNIDGVPPEEWFSFGTYRKLKFTPGATAVINLAEIFGTR